MPIRWLVCWVGAKFGCGSGGVGGWEGAPIGRGVSLGFGLPCGIDHSFHGMWAVAGSEIGVCVCSRFWDEDETTFRAGPGDGGNMGYEFGVGLVV